ncbi:hypothetical protein Tco_0317393 [Tanacetum coccineum]
MDFIGQNMDKRVLYKQQIQKWLNERKLMLQECKFQEVKAVDASSRNTDNSGIVSDKGNAKSYECSKRSNSGNDTDIRPSYNTEPIAEVTNTADYNVFIVEKQHTEQPDFINDTYVMEKNDSNVTSDSSDMSLNVKKVDQYATEHEDERVLLASLIELEKSKQDLEKSKQDLCYSKSELARYKNFQTNHKDKEKAELECAKALGLLTETKRLHNESSKTQSYAIFCVKEENAELVNQISTHESKISQILKEKEQMKKDFKEQEDKDIDKKIALENQVKILSNIVYKTS